MRKSAAASALLILALCAACTPAGTPPPAATDTAAPSPTCSLTPEKTSPPATPETFTPSPEPPLPEYANITLPGRDRLDDIFQAGLQAGMHPGVFAKVGDSLTANANFLVPFGKDAYVLGEHAYLQAAIDFFSREDTGTGNSFVRRSLAARVSWRAVHLLDPATAISPCEEGETPLACEYRILQPAIAVILLGTNDAAAPEESYEDSMREIVEYSLDRGILPILSTIPILQGRDVEPYNAFLRGLARAWDVPLIDLFAALFPLPNQGLGPDGVHLSWVEPAVFEPRYLQHGMTVRNLLTLQALDAVWKAYPASP